MKRVIRKQCFNILWPMLLMAAIFTISLDVWAQENIPIQTATTKGLTGQSACIPAGTSTAANEARNQANEATRRAEKSKKDARDTKAKMKRDPKGVKAAADEAAAQRADSYASILEDVDEKSQEAASEGKKSTAAGRKAKDSGKDDDKNAAKKAKEAAEKAAEEAEGAAKKACIADWEQKAVKECNTKNAKALEEARQKSQAGCDEGMYAACTMGVGGAPEPGGSCAKGFTCKGQATCGPISCQCFSLESTQEEEELKMPELKSPREQRSNVSAPVLGRIDTGRPRREQQTAARQSTGTLIVTGSRVKDLIAAGIENRAAKITTIPGGVALFFPIDPDKQTQILYLVFNNGVIIALSLNPDGTYDVLGTPIKTEPYSPPEKSVAIKGGDRGSPQQRFGEVQTTGDHPLTGRSLQSGPAKIR